jgi:hypothetical protein
VQIGHPADLSNRLLARCAGEGVSQHSALSDQIKKASRFARGFFYLVAEGGIEPPT